MMLGYYELFLIHPWPCAVVLMAAALAVVAMVGVLCRRSVIHIELNFGKKSRPE